MPRLRLIWIDALYTSNIRLVGSTTSAHSRRRYTELLDAVFRPAPKAGFVSRIALLISNKDPTLNMLPKPLKAYQARGRALQSVSTATGLEMKRTTRVSLSSASLPRMPSNQQLNRIKKWSPHF